MLGECLMELSQYILCTLIFSCYHVSKFTVKISFVWRGLIGVLDALVLLMAKDFVSSCLQIWHEWMHLLIRFLKF